VRLKSLEIKGFKSFADKTVVNFDQNITGIVGPNGCGKSNIVDSIRWVIGEHKISNLRSENLESLVFNGSRTRSASGLAEVSLTFENTKNLLPTEFNTVTITRKFYKSGESEYRLNDVSCRLKDIHNLFMDTGVSTDSYAIIELGMVDDIIKDKDNSRRRMLEQAAGISIYKTRKKEAKQKLDATEQDLNRIEDLLFEINNQLKSLENQAKKAEKFYEIKKEYKEISIELAKAALEGFNITYKELNQQQEQETDRKVKLEAEIAMEEAALEAEKVDFINRERALQSLQHEFNELVQTLRTKENEKNLASQKLHYLHEKEKSTKDFLEKADQQLKSLESSILFTTQQIEEGEGILETLEFQLDDVKDAVDQSRRLFDEKRGSIDELRKSSQQIQRNQFEAEKRVAVADTSIQNLNRSIQQMKEENDARSVTMSQLESDRASKAQELTEAKSSLAQLIKEHESARQLILDTQSVLEELRNELAEENRKLDAKRNEHALLKSLIDSMEGYPESIKFLHKNPDWNYNVPILQDIIYVQEGYRAALENVLEPYLNYYVVQDYQQALEAISLLDQHQKGKANFFLLDRLSSGSAVANDNKNALPTSALSALEVIEVEPVYQNLMAYLLGNVCILHNQQSIGIAADYGSWVVLEKSGSKVHGRFTLSGGSVGLFEGKKIGRAKNLEKLEEDIQLQIQVVEELKESIAARQQDIAQFNTQLKDQEIRQTQDLINQLTNAVFAFQNKAENLQAQFNQAQQRVLDLEKQVEQVLADTENVRSNLYRLNEEWDTVSEQLVGLEQDYAAAEQQYNEVSGRFNDYNLQVTRQQSKVNALKQELVFKKNQIAELHSQIEFNRSQLASTAENIAESSELLQSAEKALVDLLQRKEVEEKKLNEADQEFYNIRNKLSEKESALRQKQKSKEQLDQAMNAVRDQLNELKLQLASMKERLSVEFRVNIDDILDQERKSTTPLEELQAGADRMKKRLENMGEINPTAIEAFQEMKKRYEFILEQKNDLVTAKDSLLQTIQEVEATANQKFLDTFNQVKENFIKVFKALFTEEDQCDMILENPENLAETGIDIIAKPKGKRPSSITQLSGGEKTLTATAMLFAIYLIKPAPFCILDEVDAPLDDANVGKFTNMIRRFSETSQFIIVTHNKMTMSAVDVIYGVTMQEPGVSKLVPVDFRSLN
jgi:chromosome segregation protein